MDPALLLQRQKFAKHMAASTESALAAARQAKAAAAAAAQSSAGQSQQQQPQQQSAQHSPYQHLQHHHPGQGVRFNALSRMIRYMKQRHIAGMRHPLSLEEILEEAKMESELPQAVKVWLGQEALPQNPKLVVTVEGAVKKFQFKPIYEFRSGRSGVKDLLRLLQKFDQEGKGGLLKEDVEEGMASVDDALKLLGSRVTVLTRTSDKKVTLFNNDLGLQLPVDDEFRKLWRSCTVQSLDEQQMQQYLSGQGISAADAQRPVGFIPAGRGRRGGGAKRTKPIKLRDNEHVNHVLQDFSDLGKK